MYNWRALCERLLPIGHILGGRPVPWWANMYRSIYAEAARASGEPRSRQDSVAARVPDAVQRSRTPVLPGDLEPRCTAGPGPRLPRALDRGPASAAHHCVLRCARDTRPAPTKSWRSGPNS
jgi:hypothetical protein